MKKYILLIIALCSGLSLFGQTRVHVYLNNGTQYRNVYLKQHETDYVILNLSAPEEEEVLIRINVENIRSIRYPKGKRSAPPKVDPATLGFEKGMYYAIEMGGIVGKGHSDDSNSTTLMLKGVAGYTPVNYFAAGLGVGLDTYDDFSMVPVFLDIRGNIIEANAMPFYYVQSGYSFGWINDDGRNEPWVEEDLDTSWMFTSGLGVRFDLGKSDIILSMGYKYQKARLIQEFEWEETLVERRNINRVTFGFGIIF